ncbi:unnamed protein product, partial [Iphiclides podalirius]
MIVNGVVFDKAALKQGCRVRSRASLIALAGGANLRIRGSPDRFHGPRHPFVSRYEFCLLSELRVGFTYVAVGVAIGFAYADSSLLRLGYTSIHVPA